MSSTLRNTLVIIVMVLAIGVVGFLAFRSGKIPANEPGTIGNTGGNLNNKGLFCEKDGVVYFSNGNDQNTLYSMNPDETNIKKLGKVGIESINAGGDYLYFYQKSVGKGSGLGFVRNTTGVYRSKTNGQDMFCLRRDPAATITLVGDNLYYQHYTAKTGTTLDRIATDKSSEETIFPYFVNPASVAGGMMYYNGNDKDHYLYAYDTNTGDNLTIWQHNLWNPVYDNGYIYFMDLETTYELHRYSLMDQTEEVLSYDRVDTFNVGDGWVYYQRTVGDEPALMRVRTDGTGLEMVAAGNYENINMTSQYVYFYPFGQDSPIYKQSLHGPVNVSTFLGISMD